MIKKALLSSVLIAALFGSPAYAGKTPRPGSADARVKTLTYSESDVYRLRGHYGFSTVIEFSGKERIETISIGDSEAWQVIKPNRPNILFIKPLEENAETNMTVITTKRIYSFELSASKAASHLSENLTFRLKFQYPEETAKELAFIGSRPESNYNPLEDANAADLNFDYSYAGSKKLRPTRAFDDGTMTYFEYDDFDILPAVFAVDEHGNESLVNFNVHGDYLVISSIASQYTLRDGDVATCIFNESYPKKAEKVSKPTPIAELEKKEEKLAAKVPLPQQKPDIEALKLAQQNPGFFGRLAGIFESDDQETRMAELNN